MPSVSQESLRRIAARAIRVLGRHKDKTAALGAYVGTLDVEAQEFIDAYDAVRSSIPKRNARRSGGKEDTAALVQTLRMWLFDRTKYLIRPTVTDDVLADAERMLDSVEEYGENAGAALPYAEAMQLEVEAAVDVVRNAYTSHNSNRAELSQLLSDARKKAEAFYDELVAFRRTLRAFLGSTHPDYALIRNRHATSSSDDGGDDTIEDLADTAEAIAGEPVPDLVEAAEAEAEEGETALAEAG